MKRARVNLFGKFIVAFISVGLIPVVFIGTYSSYLFRRETYTMMDDSYRQVAVYGARNLDALVEKYNTFSKYLYSYDSYSGDALGLTVTDGLGLARVIKEDGTDAAQALKRHNTLTAFARLVYSSDTYIRNAVLVMPDGTCYTSNMSNIKLTDSGAFFDAVGHSRAYERKNKLFLAKTHKDGYFRNSSNDVFTVGRNYLDLSTTFGSEDILATLYIDVDIRAIDDIFNRMEVYQQGEIYVLDAQGELIYANPGYYERLGGDSGGAGADFLEIAETSAKSGWSVYLRADYGRAMHNVVDLIRLIYVIVIAVLAALLLLSFAYSRVFSRPTLDILTGMKKVEAGNFEAEVKVRNRDEMGQLALGFNQMVKRLEQYIQTSFLARIKQREAELAALKAQIHPHFLYNSLEIIRMNAVVNDDESTAELALLLADQMRYVMTFSNDTVTLEKELDMLRGYFMFIGVRYDNSVSHEIKAERGLLDAEVLSMMLQPVVENSIVHGLKPRGYGHVQIIIERRGDDMVIKVMDNGVGMDQETLEGLTRRLSDNGLSRKGDAGAESIGVKNVHDRLRYKYGENYGVSINSQPQIGTVVTMTLPLRRKEGSNVQAVSGGR